MSHPIPAFDPHLDLSLALRTLHELSLSEGDLGYEYWTKVYNLLRVAPIMQKRLRELEGQCMYAERSDLTRRIVESDAKTPGD